MEYSRVLDINLFTVSQSNKSIHNNYLTLSVKKNSPVLLPRCAPFIFGFSIKLIPFWWQRFLRRVFISTKGLLISFYYGYWRKHYGYGWCRISKKKVSFIFLCSCFIMDFICFFYEVIFIWKLSGRRFETHVPVVNSVN